MPQQVGPKYVIYGTEASEYTAAIVYFFQQNQIPFDLIDAGYYEFWKCAGVIPLVRMPSGKYLHDSAKMMYSLSDKHSMEELNDLRQSAMEFRDEYLFHMEYDSHSGMPPAKLTLWEFLVRMHGVGYEYQGGETFRHVYFRLLMGFNWFMRYRGGFFMDSAPAWLVKAHGLTKVAEEFRARMVRKYDDSQTLSAIQSNIKAAQLGDHANPWVVGNGITQSKRYGWKLDSRPRSTLFYLVLCLFFLLLPLNFVFWVAATIVRTYSSKYPMENDENECLEWAKKQDMSKKKCR